MSVDIGLARPGYSRNPEARTTPPAARDCLLSVIESSADR
jgi:hypothetical protein